MKLRTVKAVPQLPVRARDSHKGSCGTVLVVAGSHDMPGAAILCARGALRGGAGLVRMALPRALQVPLACAVPSATTVARDRTAQLRAAAREATALVVGPGLGATAATGRMVRSLLQLERPMVLDADALNVLAPLRAQLPHAHLRVLTPHPGEMARLLGTTTARVQADRPGAALALQQASGSVVVLKGAGTVVTDGARCFTNRSGNPGMATGGSGDVLAGLLGALLAQGMAPFEAACLAVHVHGCAGDRVASRLSEVGLCAEDLVEAIAVELGRR